MAQAPLFELQDVRYAYPSGAMALDGVSFSLRAGERVGILGANGSGKSTLLKLLDGLIVAASGSVCAWGDPLTEASLDNDRFAQNLRRRIGLVFQDADAMLFCATVREELAFGPLQLGLTAQEVEAEVESLLDTYQLRSLADRAPYELSGGEKRRVCLAAALSTRPEAILLDEPTTGLDPHTQDWLADQLCALADQGKTLLITTHDLAFAADIVERVLIFDSTHRLVADGPRDTIFADTALLQRTNLLSRRFRGK